MRTAICINHLLDNLLRYAAIDTPTLRLPMRCAARWRKSLPYPLLSEIENPVLCPSAAPGWRIAFFC
jgi:hypothetical protein